MTVPAKPPRSVWVLLSLAGYPLDYTYVKPSLRGWTRYDLHRPCKAKKRKSANLFQGHDAAYWAAEAFKARTRLSILDGEGVLRKRVDLDELLHAICEYTKRERADENVGSDEMVALWKRVCRLARKVRPTLTGKPRRSRRVKGGKHG